MDTKAKRDNQAKKTKDFEEQAPKVLRNNNTVTVYTIRMTDGES